MNVALEAKKRLRSLRTLGRFMSIRCYRHAGPMDLKTSFFAANVGEGQALALRFGRKLILLILLILEILLEIPLKKT